MNKRITPAMCGRGICGRTICGQTEKREYGDRYLGYSEYGENPKFNLQTKRMLYVLPGLSVGAENRRVSVSLVYDSDMKDGITALCAGMPSGWKLSAHEFLVTDGLDDNGSIIYKYIDGNGYVHKFEPFGRDPSRCYDTDGLGLVLTPSEKTIEDIYGNTMKFTNGRLTEYRHGCGSKATTVYEYDSDGRLTKVYDSRNMTEISPRCYLGFEYSDGRLSSIDEVYGERILKSLGFVYTEKKLTITRTSGKPIEIEYNANDKVETVTDIETNKALKATYSVPPSKINVLRVSEGSIAADGKYIEKRYIENNVTNIQTHDFTSVCEALVTDEKGVNKALQLDRRGRIISEYEYDIAQNAYKTKDPARGNSVTPRSGEASEETINGKQISSFKNSLDLYGAFPFGKGEERHRYFALTFNLKHSCDAKRLKAKLRYKVGADVFWRTSEADVNAFAYDAWQQVSIPIDSGASAGFPIMSMNLELYVPGRATEVKASAGDFRVASSPYVSVKFFGNNNEIDVGELKTLSVTYLGNNANTERVTYTTDSETEYITERDIIGSVMEAISPRNARRGGDIILESGNKRISCMSYASLLSGRPGEENDDAKEIIFANLYGSSGGCMIDTYSADDKSRTRKTIIFGVSEMRVKTTVTVCTGDKTFNNAEESEILTKGETLRITDIYGNVEKEIDAYGVTKLNEYDGYGTKLTSKLIGSDNKELVLQSNVKNASSDHITSVHTLTSGADMTYIEPYGVLHEVYAKERGTTGYVRNGAKKAYGYDATYERITGIDEYAGTTKESSIRYTYDGNVMIVSDGASEYKVENDYANGKTKYYAKDNGTYSLVEEVSDGETKYYRSSATDTVTLSADKYGKVTSISAEGTSAEYEYLERDKEGNEIGGGNVAIPIKVSDGYSGRTYEIVRDNAYNECRHTITKSGESTPVIDIRQVRSNVTEYTVPDHPVYRTTIEYDAEKTVEPRITGVKYEADNGLTMGNLDMEYTYDTFGRVKSKESSADRGVVLPIRYEYEYGTGAQTLLKTKQVVKTDYEKVYDDKTDMMVEQSTYHADGRLKNIVRTISGKSKNYTETESYTYDKFGRLTRESNTGLGINRTYAYNGKRLKSITESGSTKYMQYDSRGRLAKITNDEVGTDVYKSYAYDNYGNRISDSNRTYTWTRGRLLAGAGSTTYGYDYTGERYKKERAGSTTEYYYDNSRLICETGNIPITYHYDAEGLIGARINGAWCKIVRDLHGNVRYIIGLGYSASNTIIAQYKYDANGACTVYDRNNNITTDPDFIGNKFPIRWKGYYYDTETGLYYNGGRYYDPETGKYLDACGVEEAIAEEQLDRNGIMCDNILELMPYICTVLMGLAKDPTSEEADGNAWNMPWWAWLIIGGVIIIGLGVATAITGGSAAGVVGGIVAGAFKGSLFGAGVGAGVGALTGMAEARLNGGDIFQGMLTGMATGFASGAITGAFNGAWGSFSSKTLEGAKLLVHKSIQASGNVLINEFMYMNSSIFSRYDIGLMGFITAGIGGFLTGAFYNIRIAFALLLSAAVGFVMWAGEYIDDLWR